MNRLCLPIAGALLAALAIARPSLAGDFANIVIDDVYDDWAGIPQVVVDPDDTSTGPDIDYVQAANNGEYLFLRIHYHSADSFSTYLGIDNDSNSATGFNIFGLGTFGSEAGYANDFDFDQRAGFNIGTLKDPVRPTEPESGSALLSSFVESTDREMAIRLDTTFDPFVGAGDVFPSDTFRLMFYSLDDAFGQADISDPFSYTLAVPEPSAAMLAIFGAVAALASRRRK